MGVFVEFKSGKSINLKGSTGFKEAKETFKKQNGDTYRADAYVIFFGKGKKPIHYRKSVVKKISEN